MSGERRVLVVEDEPGLAEVLADYLGASGYAAQVMNEGNQVVERVREAPPDLILLDLMLPGKDGLTICREVRAFSAVPIIMVTARVEEIDRLLGLELGADDYICKPYSPREVVARVRAVLRRSDGTLPQAEAEAPLVLDGDKFEARLHGQLLELTPVEFRLLDTLAGQPGRVFSRDNLMEHLYDDYRIVTDRTVDSHIKNLRRKMEAVRGECKNMIRSVYGVGYKLEQCAE